MFKIYKVFEQKGGRREKEWGRKRDGSDFWRGIAIESFSERKKKYWKLENEFKI